MSSRQAAWAAKNSADGFCQRSRAHGKNERALGGKRRSMFCPTCAAARRKKQRKGDAVVAGVEEV